MTTFAVCMAQLSGRPGDVQVQIAGANRRIDCRAARPGRIERRFDLTEA